MPPIVGGSLWTFRRRSSSLQIRSNLNPRVSGSLMPTWTKFMMLGKADSTPSKVLDRLETARTRVVKAPLSKGATSSCHMTATRNARKTDVARGCGDTAHNPREAPTKMITASQQTAEPSRAKSCQNFICMFLASAYWGGSRPRLTLKLKKICRQTHARRSATVTADAATQRTSSWLPMVNTSTMRVQTARPDAVTSSESGASESSRNRHTNSIVLNVKKCSKHL
mmetsp:Transcript_60565/g.144295  ORF Transcript_60565/g.144295 Transcript_60565/m.144295 type:complete len:225 (-) Transcript_60565:2207-2881(-)